MLNRSIRYALAATALAALSMTGAQAANIPATSTPSADSSLVQVHNYCYKGYYYYHTNKCQRWGYDSYGNYVCVKYKHRRKGYCGGGGSY